MFFETLTRVLAGLVQVRSLLTVCETSPAVAPNQ